MKYLLIMNPGSKGGSSQKRFEEIFNLFHQSEVDFDYKLTSNLEEAYQFSKLGNEVGYGCIVAVGGDGTLNRVLNGFFDQDGRRLSKAKMGVIYTGTSPDFCKSYGIPIDLEDAVQILLKGKSRKIQVGQIKLASTFQPDLVGKGVGEGEPFITRYFACCANLGIGASLARRANSGIRKYWGDHLGTFLALLRTLYSYRPSTFTLLRDGEREELSKVFSLSVGKTYYIASGIKVRHSLVEGDGRFYNLLVRGLGVRDWPWVFRQIYSGQQIKNNENLSLEYSKVIEIIGNFENPEVEFDGDPVGYLPCRIEMAKDWLELVGE